MRTICLCDLSFSNDPDFSNGILGNFTFSISDHLPQFLILPGEMKAPPNKHNILRRKKKFVREELVADVVNIDGIKVVSPEKMDSNFSLNSFKDTIYEVLDKHMPLKKSKQKRAQTWSQTLDNPWYSHFNQKERPITEKIY